jgi:alcohol dehydrogenase class IV
LSHALCGTLNFLFLPAVVEFKSEAASVKGEAKLERISHAMGLSHADAITGALRTMTIRLGLPVGLGTLGVSPELSPRTVTAAKAGHSHASSHRAANDKDHLWMQEQSIQQ